MPAAQHPSKSDDMAPRQNPRGEVIQPPHLGVQRLGANSTASIHSSSSIYSMALDIDESPRTSALTRHGASNDDLRTFSSRRISELAQSIDGPSFQDVDWTKRRRAEARHPERSTNLETTHGRREPKKFVKGICLARVKASIRRRRKMIKGGTNTGTSSNDAQPQRGPQSAIAEEYRTLIGNGPYGMQMQTGVITTDSDYSSLDHGGYNSESSDYNDSTSSDHGESEYIGSGIHDADRASAVYLNSEYARTDEINDAFGDGRYVRSPDGSLVARRDLGPLHALHALHARAASKIRVWRRAAICGRFSSVWARRKAEAAASGRVSNGANAREGWREVSSSAHEQRER